MEGFSRGFEPKEIVGTTVRHDELHFLMTWQVLQITRFIKKKYQHIFFFFCRKSSDDNDFVPLSQARERCPDLVIDYLVGVHKP